MPTCTYCHKELPNNGKKLISGAKIPYYKSVKYCGSFCLKENWRFKHSPPIGSREKQCLQCSEKFITAKFQPNRQRFCSSICSRECNYILNKQKYIKRASEWGKSNKDKLRITHRRYYWNNANKVRLQKRARNTGHITEKQWRELCEKNLYSCKHCSTIFDISLLTIDHIIPVTRGGSNNIGNLQPLCFPCNRKKGNHFIG